MSAKPIVVLLFFLLFFAIFAGGVIGDTDLTQGGQKQTFLSGSADGINFDVFGSDSPASSSTSNPGGAMEVSAVNSGASGNSYTVKSGDTLSRIAQSNGVVLKDLLAANPSISNPNLIGVGQKITLPENGAAPAQASTPTPTLTFAPTVAPSATPDQGLQPGDLVNIEVKGFPPNAEVEVAIGRIGYSPASVEKMETGENGVLKTSLVVPEKARPNEKWTVSITTVKPPRMKVTAAPFLIGN